MSLIQTSFGYCIRFGRMSIEFSLKQFVIYAIVVALVLISCLISLAVGTASISPISALKVLLGGGDSISIMLVEKIRLPRVVAALISGFALGLSGCLIQTIVKNRLATPEIMGVNEGAALAVVVVSAFSMSGVWAWWVGPLGAGVAFLLLLLLAGRPGNQGYRLIIIGMAISELLRSSSDLLISMQEMHLVTGLYIWKTGSLIGQGYEVSLPVLIGLLAILPLLFLLSQRLKIMQLDDVCTQSLGVSLVSTQIITLMIAVTVAGLACGITGPIAFVAMASPIVASYLVGPTRVPIWLSAIFGALLVVVADTLARAVSIGHQEIGVGIITSLIGGPFMLWVLLRDKAGE